jgi:hypothetical protein
VPDRQIVPDDLDSTNARKREHFDRLQAGAFGKRWDQQSADGVDEQRACQRYSHESLSQEHQWDNGPTHGCVTPAGLQPKGLPRRLEGP